MEHIQSAELFFEGIGDPADIHGYKKIVLLFFHMGVKRIYCTVQKSLVKRILDIIFEVEVFDITDLFIILRDNELSVFPFFDE